VIRVVNPATGEEIAAYPKHTAEQIEGALGAAQTAQRGWRREIAAVPPDRIRAARRRRDGQAARRGRCRSGQVCFDL
jgi:acyl-CoA reductase-like NAD-dependent aldehyde dehydrogenase